VLKSRSRPCVAFIYVTWEGAQTCTAAKQAPHQTWQPFAQVLCMCALLHNIQRCIHPYLFQHWFRLQQSPLQGCKSFILCHTQTHTHTHSHTHTHTCTHTHAQTHTRTHTHMHTHMHRHTHVHTHTHTCLKGCFSTLLFALFEYSKWLKITGRCCWAWRPLPQVISVPFLCMQCSLCNTSLLSLQSSFACYRRRLQPNRVMIVRLCAIRCICVWVQLLLRCGSLCSFSSKMHGTDIFTFSQPQLIPWGILLPRTRPKGTSFMPLFWFCCVKLPGSAFPIASCMLVPALGVFIKSIDT